MITILNRRTKRFCSFFLVGIALVAAKAPADFERLLINPQAFHQKRISLTGVAHILGDEFFLYQNGYEAQKAQPSRAVLIVRNLQGPLYSELNNHWVKVTGIVDANAHGLLGTAPCEIALIKLQALARPAFEDRDIYGVFRNDTGTAVNLRAPAPGGYTDVDLKPGQVATFVIATGLAVVNDMASGKMLFKTELNLRAAPKPYRDSGKKIFYYTITKGEIKMVPPDDGKRWKR
jgi:hypothetical protein